MVRSTTKTATTITICDPEDEGEGEREEVWLEDNEKYEGARDRDDVPPDNELS